MEETKIIRQYGKNIEDVFAIKSNYINEDKTLLKKYYEISEIYKKQPYRKNCKLCGNEILDEVNWFSHPQGEFCTCSICGHINGKYEDTYEFSNKLYSDKIRGGVI